MITLAMVSQKGGVGRSSIALNLVGMHPGKALVIDTDPQGSVLAWGQRRGDRKPDVGSGNPAALEKEIGEARQEGYDLVIIDTPPFADRVALQAARVADLVLLPCRPAMFDLLAISQSLDLCKIAARPAMVIINAAPIRSRVVQEAIKSVQERGGIVASTVIRQRVAYQHCLLTGDTVAEFEPGGAAETEMRSLWEDVNVRIQSDTNATSQADVPASINVSAARKRKKA